MNSYTKVRATVLTCALFLFGHITPGLGAEGQSIDDSYSDSKVLEDVSQDLRPWEGAAYDPQHKPSRVHVWYIADGKIPGAKFGTYTYVLMPTEDDECGATGRLELTLKALKKSTMHLPATYTPQSTNLFVIPLTIMKRSRTPASGDASNFKNAHEMCLAYQPVTAWNMLRAMETQLGISEKGYLKDFPSSAVGPIFISTNVPYSQLTKNSPVLWFDLSHLSTDAIPQVLEEYKKRISTDPITTAGSFNSFAASFLKFLSTVNSAIRATLGQYKEITEK